MKPTLQEIAAMAYPASLVAVRRHYDPLWGKLPEADGDPRPFKVNVEWEVTETGTFTTTVVASSEEEAKLLAEEEFGRRHDSDHEVMSVDIREVSQ